MNKFLFTPVILGIGFGIMAFRNTASESISEFDKNHNIRYGGGLTFAATGAPGEGNCTQCHGGSAVQDGTNENVLSIKTTGGTPVNSFQLNTDYDVTLVMNSDPAKKGFQSVVLTSAQEMAGSFTPVSGGGALIKNINGNNYATHSSSSNTNATVEWKWKWTSPATAVGPVTFYVATNKANGNNGTSGDVIYLSQYVVDGPQSSASIVEVEDQSSKFVIGYNPSNHNLAMNFFSLVRGSTILNLVDLNGKSVFTYDLGESKIGENVDAIQLPESLKNGIYVANVLVNNKAMSKKIMVQR